MKTRRSFEMYEKIIYTPIDNSDKKIIVLCNYLVIKQLSASL